MQRKLWLTQSVGSVILTIVAFVCAPTTSVTALAATSGPRTVTGCRAIMSGTFIQPSASVLAWSAARYNQELSQMGAVGIKSVIDQWTVDMDANTAYYPAAPGWYPRGVDMVGSLLSSAGTQRMGVWLGLGNVYGWQSHATDAAWLANQLYIDEQTADQLWALYPGRFSGWYVSNEVDDVLLSTGPALHPMTWFFSSLAQYLHTHDGDLPVMTSPTYSGLHQSTAQFAQSVKSVLAAVDIVNVQDGGGSGYIGPANINDWFSALSSALAGTNTALWQDADMYAVTGGPIAPAKLQSDLTATCGHVTGRTGFSFATQMGPLDLRTSSYYDAYRAYVSRN